MKLTSREADELLDAIEYAEKTVERITAMEHAARMRADIPADEIWELKNYAAQIEAVLYNVHRGVYRRDERAACGRCHSYHDDELLCDDGAVNE